MAISWNNEYVIALEGKDLQANAMALDNTGTYVLLAGRRYIAIRNLNEEYEVIQKFPRQSKYDVYKAEWNPTVHSRELCVLVCNQRLEVLAWHKEELRQVHSLKAHTRIITDVNWHQSEPNLLASCSADSFIHIWDIRDARRPTSSFTAIAEASQVRWNRISSHLLATAHEGDLKIWDYRKANIPVQYVAAHVGKIHGLDWNPFIESQIATCSQDCSVKFFDTTSSRKADYTLMTSAPVWRARFTPFGNGLITACAPQLKRVEHSLLLWNTANRATPMHTFIGHRDVVLEFDWRKKRPGESEFQLVTWSKDQTLLVWKIEPFLQKLCGHEPDDSKDVEEINIDPSSAVKVKKKTSLGLQPLQQEFSLLNVQIPNLEVKDMDATARTCQVQAQKSSFTIKLHISFPTGYPHGVPPVFEIIPDSTVTDLVSNQLLQTLNHLAQQRVSKNRTCLESCLRQLVATLEQLSRDSENDIYETSYIESNNAFGGFNDAYIPFPRTSGAKFCSANILVCFIKPTARRTGKIESTPRALSALEAYSKHSVDHLPFSANYLPKHRIRSRRNTVKSLKMIVCVYDCSGLFFVNRKLAEDYILNGDISMVCKHNGAAAAVVGRWDLMQAWTIAELISEPQRSDEDEESWYYHPFNTFLMPSLIDHYAMYSDFQMAAMLCCIFGEEEQQMQATYADKSPESLSPYQSADIISEGWIFPTVKTTSSSNTNISQLNEIPQSPNDLSGETIIEQYKLAYAETLHRWGLLYNRAEVFKYINNTKEPPKGVGFLSNCKYCSKLSRGSSCGGCKKLSLICIICQISVRGLANCCFICGHGGHVNHLQSWFEKNDNCPSGCGCKCLQETRVAFGL